MILNLHVKSIETKVYMSQEEISKHHNINVSNEITINSPSSVGEQDIVKVNWTLSITYLNPSIGYIRIIGTMDCKYDNPTFLLKNIPNDIKSEMTNTILFNLASYLIDTAKLHNIPSPIPIPKITFGEPKKTNSEIKYHG